MKTRTLVVIALFAAACGKKAEEKKGPEPKVVDKKTPEVPVAPAAPLARMTVTSKSPEAVAEWQKGRDAAMLSHGEEAMEHFKKAIALDPEFAIATADVGSFTPGPDGTELLQKAGPLAAKLPEAERVYVEAAQAGRAGDATKNRERLEKLLELAPGEWEVAMQLSYMATGRGDSAAALKYLEQAQSIKPDAAVVQNGLAYAYLAQRDWDKSIAAAKKQVELLPKEPNPLDSLGEIQLNAGKYEDAEKSFVAATTLDPKFWLAYNGAALARAYHGDFKGAYAALDEQKKSTVPGEKFSAMLDTAWLQFAENKLPDALKTLDALDKDPEAKKFPPWAFSALVRGHMLGMDGKHAEATKAYAMALTRKDVLAGDGRNGLMTGYRAGTLRVAAMQGKPAADADKLLADAEAFAKTTPDDKFAQSMLAYDKGLAVWAKGDAKAAVAELSKCEKEMLGCRHDLAIAMRKAGDAAGADEVEKDIATRPTRDAGAIYVLSHPSK